ncbi:MAG: COQ9 family protein [Micavibrio sp.]
MERNEIIKSAIIEAALPDVVFDGWTAEVLERGAVHAGYEAPMARAVFPRGTEDALIHFSHMADGWMMEKLAGTNKEEMRVRDRIALAVRARLQALEPHKEAERLAAAWWMRPLRKYRAAKLVWKTADIIWIWAGDTATDYNRYTKRALLSGVLGSSLLFWLQEDDEAEVAAFIERRIENIMALGKIAARRKSA